MRGTLFVALSVIVLARPAQIHFFDQQTGVWFDRVNA
jgi:hypothetical protein